MMKRNFLLTAILLVIFTFQLAFTIWGQDCPGFKLKTDMGLISFEGGAKSLKTELDLFNQTTSPIQWRIPTKEDLEIIKNCPGLKSQLKQDIYYWTQIKNGIFYRCFKLDKTRGEIVMADRVSPDGANGLLIAGNTVPGAPDPVSPIIAFGGTVPANDRSTIPGDNAVNTGDVLSKPVQVTTTGADRYFTYRVKRDETLYSIAESFNLDTSTKGLDQLARLNNMPSIYDLKVYSNLKLPVPPSCINGIVIEKYPVKPGDTFRKIANKFWGRSFFKNIDQLNEFKEFQNAICKWNEIKNSKMLKKNTELTIYLCK